MSVEPKKARTIVPSLARKWDPQRNRYVVVLKVPKWDRGTILMCEAPLAIACGYQRPMSSDLEESARMKRWLQASGTLKWKPEEILFYEILLYCRDHQRGKRRTTSDEGKEKEKTTYGPERPPPTPPPSNVDEPLESKFIKSAEWLMKDRQFAYRFNEKKTVKENILQVLEDTCLINDTFFSRREKGQGWYPLMGHVRQMPVVSNEINACVWFVNSVAHLAALVDLKQGDEIVIQDNQEGIAQLHRHQQNQFMTIATVKDWENIPWQQLAKTVAESGVKALDRLHEANTKPNLKYIDFLSSLRDDAVAYLKIQWLNVEHKFLIPQNPRFGTAGIFDHLS